MNTANAQALVDAELEAIETEQAAVFEEVADETTLISDIARGKAQIRATIEADCRAIAAIKADAKEADNIAEGMTAKPILTALKAIRGAILTDNEVNAILCDAFGSKDGKGKTPVGEGLSIRKRVRTLDTARRIVAGEKLDKAPTWADWNDTESLTAMVESVFSGEASPSYVYAKITKRPESSKLILALDAKQIALLAEQLINPDTIAGIAASDALKVAYAALKEKLAAID